MPCQVKRGDGLGDIVTAALYKKAIEAGTQKLDTLLREAKVTAPRDVIAKIVLLAQNIPFMDEDTRDELFKILVNSLKPQAQVGKVSPYDVNQVWIKAKKYLGPRGQRLPEANDPRIRSLFQEVISALSGYGGQLDPNNRPNPGTGPMPGTPPGQVPPGQTPA